MYRFLRTLKVVLIFLCNGVKPSTSASGSQPLGNTKKDKIRQTPSSTQKNKHSKLNANSELKCVKCNGCMLSDNHDLCVLDFINNVNARKKSKSVNKSSKRKVWKPTGKKMKHPKPVVTLVYSRKPRKSKTNVPVSKSKVLKSVSANKKEPSKSWGSIVFDVPSSSLDECRNDLCCKDNWVMADIRLVAFRQHTCFIRNLEGVDLLIGSRGNNLYTLSLGDMMASSPICLLSKALKTNKEETNKPNLKTPTGKTLSFYHMDLCGPMHVASINGKKYILVIIDYYSRFTWVKFLRSKDEAPDFIINFLKMIKGVDISHETSVARSPQQNGVVERRNRTLIEAARTMLIYAKGLFKFLWAEAVATACYTQNHSIIRLRHGKTPYELLHDKPPDLSFFHVFGALCYLTNDSEKFGKLQPKADIDFDELTAMASEHSSSGPALHEMTPATISSRLVPNPSPLTPNAEALNEFRSLEVMELVPRPKSYGYYFEVDLQVKLDEWEVYVSQPDGFVDPDNHNHVYKLKKALYGLKQALRAWRKRITSGLVFVDDIFLQHLTPVFGIYLLKSLLDTSLGGEVQTGADKEGKKSVDRARVSGSATKNTYNAVSKGYFSVSIRGTVNWGTWLIRWISSIAITAFADADHAGCQDTRHNTSGSMQFLGDRLVSWSSKRQKSAAISSTEAEYIAMSGCCAQILWMRSQLTDYGLGFNKIPMSKHIDIRFHFIKEHVENEVIELYFVNTEYQLADIFTKALTRERIEFSINKLGMRSFTPETLKQGR
ncbi:retrovirus-related pol polyprotein from transposon TNT 1-94 [Tanacetum coccineum]